MDEELRIRIFKYVIPNILDAPLVVTEGGFVLDVPPESGYLGLLLSYKRACHEVRVLLRNEVQPVRVN
jgi:hypothetical protein